MCIAKYNEFNVSHLKIHIFKRKIWKMVHLCNFHVDLGHHYGICENFETLNFIVSECVVDLFSSP